VFGRLKRAAFKLAGRLPARAKIALVQMREAPYRPFAPWGLPSGVLKPNESLEDSMKREIREEAELEVEFEEILRVRASSRPRRVDVWMRYRSTGGTPRPRSAEVEAAEFFDMNDLPELIVEQQRFLADNRQRIVASSRAH